MINTTSHSGERTSFLHDPPPAAAAAAAGGGRGSDDAVVSNAQARLSRSNRGPVALCTVGLGLLNPPSFRGR